MTLGPHSLYHSAFSSLILLTLLSCTASGTSFWEMGELSVSQDVWGETTPPTVCTGNFTIRTQADVDALAGCSAIDGDLNIVDSTEDLNLTPLSSLMRVSGYLIIRDNTQLQSLDGLGNLTMVGKGLVLNSNQQLASLAALRNLATIGESLNLFNDPLLATLDGLDNLTSVGGDAVIFRLQSLTSIAHLTSLSTIGGDLRIAENSSLSSLDGLQNLSVVGGGGRIRENNLLLTLDGLQGLTSLSTNLEIQNNYALVSLEGLQNLATIGGDLSINGNSFLSDLSSLLNLQSVGRHLRISSNRLIVTLNGLQSLSHVGGNLTIGSNTSLSSLLGLINLNTVGASLFVDKCNSLGSLDGLNNLTSIGDSLGVSGNAQMTSLDGLQGLSSVAGIVFIYLNSSLSSLEGLNSLTSAGDDFHITENTALVTLDGLHNFSSVAGHLAIGYNATLVSLDGLQSLASVGGDLQIDFNENLRTLDGLENLSRVEGSLYIRDNVNLLSIEALQNLGYVGGTSEIINNTVFNCSLFALPFFPVHVSTNNLVDCGTRTLIASVSPLFIDFGSRLIERGPTEPATVRITNRGTVELGFILEGIEVTGPHDREFMITNNPSTAPMIPMEEREVNLVFDPLSRGERTAQLNFTTNSDENPLIQVILVGSGVDPSDRYLSSPNPSVNGSFGSAVAGLPDIDRDGRDEVIVGAYGEGAGRVHIFDASEMRLIRTLDSPSATTNDLFGAAVAALAEPSGSRQGWVLVGAHQADSSRGRAYIFDASNGSLVRSVPSPAIGAKECGTSVSNVPDINGDGMEDCIVGAPDPKGYEGNAFIFDSMDGSLLHTLKSPIYPIYRGGLFGKAVGGIEDINGDGRGDVIVGAPRDDPPGSHTDAGRVYIFDGFAGTLLKELRSPNENVYGHFGQSVAGIPDTNGDGRGEVLIGAPNEAPPGYPAESGSAYLFDGSSGELLFSLRSPNKELKGHFGSSVSGALDIDGDGSGDVIVGAQDESPGPLPDQVGRAYIFSGATGKLLRTLTSLNEEEGGHFGNSVSGMFDANGDGLGDVIVGAMHEDPENSPVDSGRAYVFLSSAAVIEVTPTGLSFGERNVQHGPTAALPLTLHNKGDGLLQFLGPGLALTGADSGDFRIDEGMPPYPLDKGMSEVIQLAFDPASIGPKTAVLRITTKDPTKREVEVLLEGLGTIFSADANQDQDIDSLDLLAFMVEWRDQIKGMTGGLADLNQDGTVDYTDLFLFADQWEP